jgi:hypothetical protein
MQIHAANKTARIAAIGRYPGSQRRCGGAADRAGFTLRKAPNLSRERASGGSNPLPPHTRVGLALLESSPVPDQQPRNRPHKLCPFGQI